MTTTEDQQISFTVSTWTKLVVLLVVHTAVFVGWFERRMTRVETTQEMVVEVIREMRLDLKTRK